MNHNPICKSSRTHRSSSGLTEVPLASKYCSARRTDTQFVLIQRMPRHIDSNFLPVFQLDRHVCNPKPVMTSQLRLICRIIVDRSIEHAAVEIQLLCDRRVSRFVQLSNFPVSDCVVAVPWDQTPRTTCLLMCYNATLCAILSYSSDRNERSSWKCR